VRQEKLERDLESQKNTSDTLMNQKKEYIKKLLAEMESLRLSVDDLV
jgi:hypothetical protein